MELLRCEENNIKAVPIPFVVRYHPQLKNLSKGLHTHLKYSHNDPEARVVFAHVLF